MEPTLRCRATLLYFDSHGALHRKRLFPAALLEFLPPSRVLIYPTASSESPLHLPLKPGAFSVYAQSAARGAATLQVTGLPAPTPSVMLQVAVAAPPQLALLLRCLRERRLARRGECGAAAAAAAAAAATAAAAAREDALDLLHDSAPPPPAGRAAAAAAAASAARAPLRGAAPAGAAAAALPALTPEQRAVLAAVASGRGVFFTGSAGTGKSLVLRHLRVGLDPAVTAFTASTGVAAVALGGTTVHAWAGLSPGALEAVEGGAEGGGCGGALPQLLRELRRRREAVARWRRTRTLVVDEVSMLSAPLLDALDFFGRALRECEDKPFGGLQVVLAGDFFQLPPVGRGGAPKRFAFQARCWGAAVPLCVQLTRVFRQGEDGSFVALLAQVRRGTVSPECEAALAARWRAPLPLAAGVLPTRLHTHRADVDAENAAALAQLPGEARVFSAADAVFGPPSNGALLAAGCPAAAKLSLKVGAQVLLTKTLDAGAGLVNGARGVVTGFGEEGGGGGGFPRVRFLPAGGSGAPALELIVRPEVWEVSVGGVLVATRRALPLDLAWTISIHKSQGMTLDAVEMSLARVFEVGQAYVALSRARSLATLSLTDRFEKDVVKAHPAVVAFYEALGRGGVGAPAPPGDGVREAPLPARAPTLPPPPPLPRSRLSPPRAAPPPPPAARPQTLAAAPTLQNAAAPFTMKAFFGGKKTAAANAAAPPADAVAPPSPRHLLRRSRREVFGSPNGKGGRQGGGSPGGATARSPPIKAQRTVAQNMGGGDGV